MAALLLVLLVTICQTSASPEASLLVSPTRTQFFEYENFTLRCEASSGGPWTVWRYTRSGPGAAAILSQCSSGWGVQTASGCDMKTVKLSDSGVYWCGAKHGGSSDGVNITVSGGPLILQSPLSPVVSGADVFLSCKTKNFTSDPAEFWKDNTKVTTAPTHRMMLHNVSSSDQSSYTCSFPALGTSPPTWLLLPEDAEPPQLTVQPDSVQTFEYKNVMLSCGEWTVVRASTDTKTLQNCGDQWGAPASTSCTIHTTKKSDSGVYWCESASKRRSNSINLNVHDGPVILQSPALPVDQGQNVTLYCRARTSPALPADFYKDGSFMGAGPEGNFTLFHVSSDDEGSYSCSINGHERSPSSWMSVTGHGSMDMYGAGRSMTPLRLLCHLVVFCPYCISTVLLVRLCRRRGGSMDVSTEMTPLSNAGGDRSSDDVTTEHHF